MIEDECSHDEQQHADVGAAHHCALRVGTARQADVEDAEDGGDGAAAAQQEQEGDDLLPARHDAKDHAGDDGAHIAFEQVGSHAGHIAHVVAHVVGDNGGVARVVLRNALLNLAHQIGANVGRLGVDATADTAEQRHKARTEAEAGQNVGVLKDQIADRHAEQAEADDAETHDRTAGERSAQRGNFTLLRGLRRARIGNGGAAHADKPGQQRHHGAADEADRNAPAHGRQEEEDDGQRDDEHGHHAVFAAQERHGAAADKAGDLRNARIPDRDALVLQQEQDGEQQGKHRCRQSNVKPKHVQLSP